MEPPNYPNSFRERWYLIALASVIGVLIAAGASALLPRSYEATATLFLRVDSPESSLVEQSQFALARIKSYPELVTSPQVLRQTIADLGTDTTPQQLSSRLSAANPRDTVLLTVTATASRPDLAADTANSAARHLSQLVDSLESDVSLRLTLPATAPVSAASPQPTILMGLGFLGGLALGAILVAALGQLDPRVRTVAEVRALSGLPVVGQLTPGITGAIRRGRLSRRADEALRTTIVNQRLLTGERRPRVIAVVPAGRRSRLVAGSAVAALARTLVGAGDRTVIIASDSAPRRGVAAALDRAVDTALGWLGWGAAEHPNPPRITIPGDGDPARSAAILEKVAEAIADHDVVLITADSPTDIFALADIVGLEVLVAADRRRTSRTALVDATTSLEFAGTRPVAVLMTETGTRARVDLPATWLESDRVALAPLALPAAPPKRRRTSTRTRRPAAKPAAASSADDDPQGAAEAVGPTEAETPEHSDSDPHQAHESEILDGLEIDVHDDSDDVADHDSAADDLPHTDEGHDDGGDDDDDDTVEPEQVDSDGAHELEHEPA
ncbi:YveK family protein [Homoserinibacter sp. GY 40078]|uniref:YveK family protein n=1 Tax=Homoserinibacter sp. GY 40078 TaxID=2603275 RepID=UPI00164FD999|nr:Wzz/FepE/Etk N-terminal domain-containing protein [Homoserinibacter sp. GY 40078]